MSHYNDGILVNISISKIQKHTEEIKKQYIRLLFTQETVISIQDLSTLNICFIHVVNILTYYYP